MDLEGFGWVLASIWVSVDEDWTSDGLAGVGRVMDVLMM